MTRMGSGSRTVSVALIAALMLLDFGPVAAQQSGGLGPAPGTSTGPAFQLPNGSPSLPSFGEPGRAEPAREPAARTPQATTPPPAVTAAPAPLRGRCQVAPVPVAVPVPVESPAAGIAGAQPQPGALSVAAAAGQLPRVDIERRTTALAAAPGLARAPQEEISRIEAGFQALPFSVESAAPLRQFGYEMFNANVSTFAPIDDVPVGPDYVLGPGDDLTIHVWGPVDSTVVRTVDRNGRIVLPKIGDLRVWGLSFSEADRLIREQLSRYFRGFKTSVTMGRLRTIRVHVIGEVCQPGVYTLSALATLTNALYASGGPTKLGSLREVRLMRNHHTVGTLDLYDFLLRGDRTRDFRLESGDTVFVPTIGDVAAIAGEVKRPAIYEIGGELRVADLIDMAGGITPTAYLKRVQVVRAQPSAERVTLDVDLSDYYLKRDAAANPLVRGGDLVLVHRSDPRIYNVVKVAGAVKYPGAYELKPMARISDLLPPDRLLPEAYPEQVEVARRKPDLSLEILPVNLKKAWKGERDADLLLRPLDEVTVRTELRPAQTVTLSGEVVRPGTYTITEGERLSSVIERAGGFTEKAYLKGAVFTRAALRDIEQKRLDEFMRVQEQRLLAAASAEVVAGLDREESAVSAEALKARRDFLKVLASRVAVGRMVVRLDAPERLKGTENDIVLMGGDTLQVPPAASAVLVLGAVRSPASILYQPGADLEYYLNRVGGLSKEADKKEIHIVKADGSAVSSFAKIREIEPGDTVVVPPKEELKVKVLPTVRDVVQTIGSTMLSIAALAILF